MGNVTFTYMKVVLVELQKQLIMSLRFHYALCVLFAFALSWHGAAHPSSNGIVVAPDFSSASLAGHALYLEDPKGQLDLAAIQSRINEFKATDATKGINFSYTASAYWFRVALDNPTPLAAARLLEIAFPPLDRIDVHFVTRDRVRSMQAGDQVPFSIRPIAHHHYVFPIDVPPGDSEIYLRVTSSGSISVPATLWAPDHFARQSEVRYAFLAAYFGWIFALISYNLMLFTSTRDRAYLAYVAFASGLAIASLAYTGLGAQFFWPESPRWGDPSIIAGLCMTVLFGGVFTRMFLHTPESLPRVDLLLHIVAWGAGLALILLAALPQRYPTLMIVAFGSIFVTAGPFIGFLAVRKQQAGARFYLAAWSFFFLGTIVFILRNTGVLPTNAFTLYAIQLGSAFEMLLLSFALADRMNTLRREKEQAQLASLKAERTLIDGLRRSEAILEERVSQRTAELAAANTLLGQKEQTMRDLAHHDPLTGLANRLLLSTHLQQSIKRARRNSQPFALLMIDLDGFKPVNDLHGHDAGDLLLRAIAKRLTANVRESDLVARVGGDEFVCVLESVDESDAAVAVANKLIREVRGPVRLEDGEEVTVGASIGIAMFDESISATDQLLRFADDAMYAAKAAGKNCARLSSGAQSVSSVG